MSTFLLPAYHVVTALAAILVPLLGGLAPAAAIIVFTALVRLALHPLNRAQYRAQQRADQARAALAPAVARLRRRHEDDPARLLRETSELYRANGVSPVAGVLPALAQAPVLFVMYRLFVSSRIGGHRNALLGDTLFGVPLGSRLRDATTTSHILVFVTLLAVIAGIATWAVRRAKAAQHDAQPATPTTSRRASRRPTQPSQDTPHPPRVLAWLPYLTVLTAAFVPLATGLYLATTTLWTVVERRVLTRRPPTPQNGPQSGPRTAAATG